MSTRYADYIQRKRREFGDRFSTSDLAPEFVEHFNTGARVRVRFSYGEERTGTIGVTTGWRPCFLLMSRKTDHGSSDTLSTRDRVVGVQLAGSTKYIAK